MMMMLIIIIIIIISWSISSDRSNALRERGKTYSLPVSSVDILVVVTPIFFYSKAPSIVRHIHDAVIRFQGYKIRSGSMFPIQYA
jgi:hypothetical protein